MKGCWTPGSIQGIPLRIHWSFLLIILWSAYSGSEMGGLRYIGYSVFLTCLVFVCVVLHELGHALAAKRYGVATRSITLLPIGGVAALDRIPERPREEFVIAIAGPLVNVIIVGILLLLAGWPDLSVIPFGVWSFKAISAILVYVNMIMIVFNLIPAFPMDGGRMFRSLLAIKLPYPAATAVAATVGQLMAVLMLITGLFFNPVLCLIAMFVFLGARAENNMVHLRAILQGKVVRDLMRSPPIVWSPDMPVPHPDELTDDARGEGIIVMIDDRVMGVISHDALVKHTKEGGSLPLASTVMSRPTILLRPDMPLMALLSLAGTTSQSVFPVMENGLLIGLVTRKMIYAQARGGQAESPVATSDNRGTREPPTKSFIDIG